MATSAHFAKKNRKKSCVLIWNGEKCIRKWFSVIQNGRRQPFCENLKKIKVAYWSEMARNVIESDFCLSKMAAGSHFVNKFNKIKVAYWSEMARNAIKSDFRSSKVATGSHFVKKNKIKVAYWSEMARNAIEIHFRSSNMGRGGGITMASL